MSHVLIVFQTNTESIEQLALAVAVGAVEAEALIRLRRLATPDSPEVAHKSYGKLQAADLLWADVIVVGLEAAAPDPGELGPLFDVLAEKSTPSKLGWTFGPDGPDMPLTQAQIQVVEAFRAADITLLPLPGQPADDDLITRMKACGHLLAAAGRNV